jgi:histidinol-phosphatase
MPDQDPSTPPATTGAWLPDPTTPLGAAVALAMACCDEADGLALRSFRRAMQVEAKPDRSYVTEVDRSIEERLRRRILEAFPDHGLVGEEFGEHVGASGRRWFIDPIDGTHNYMRGIPLFGTLLGLEADGEMTVGVMSAPALGRRWLAWRGGGAWSVDLRPGGWVEDSRQRVRVSRIARLDEAQVLYSSLPEVLRSGLAPGFEDVVAMAWRDRGLGDFWGYALVAEGAAEVMLEIGIKPWDLAAPTVLVEEAGGRITDLSGRRGLDGSSVLATNGVLHEQVLARLAERPPEGSS